MSATILLTAENGSRIGAFPLALLIDAAGDVC
jgi:hypothetical protein